LQQTQFAGRLADFHKDNSHGAGFGITIGDSKRNAFALFILCQNNELPGFSFAGDAGGIEFEKMDIGN
jgi:hypothetical protein